MTNRKLEKENTMYLIDLAPIQLPPEEFAAAVALREEKVARLKEQMGHTSLLVRRLRRSAWCYVPVVTGFGTMKSAR